jgi:hypothetical protein
MGWCHQVDIDATHFLKFDHGLGQSFVRDLDAFSLNADRVILAINTTQIAVGEKYSS